MNTEVKELTVEVSSKAEKYEPIMGGDDSNPTWDEYVGNWLPEFQPHINLIKDKIKELGWVGETAEHKANDTCFKFSDGECWGFSWRAWGDLMQAIVNKKEGYIKYYM